MDDLKLLFIEIEEKVSELSSEDILTDDFYYFLNDILETFLKLNKTIPTVLSLIDLLDTVVEHSEKKSAETIIDIRQKFYTMLQQMRADTQTNANYNIHSKQIYSAQNIALFDI